MKIGKRIAALMLIGAISLVGVGCSQTNGETKSARVIRVAHGQNENHSFMDKANHIHMLDDYSETTNLLCEYSELYENPVSKRCNQRTGGLHPAV